MLHKLWPFNPRSGRVSRPLLEGAVRDFLKRNTRVAISEKARVEGWTFAGDVLVRVVTSCGGAVETIPADFVIDATGRSGNSVAWLEAGGFGPVEETKLEIGTGYASAVFKKPANWQCAVDGLSISNRDPDTKGGFIFSIEHDCWLASRTGRFDQQPPGDPDRFMAFAQSLCVPDFYDWISKGERPANIDVRIAYSRGLRKLIEDDAEVHRLMGGITHLVHPLEVIRRPDIVVRVKRVIVAGMALPNMTTVR